MTKRYYHVIGVVKEKKGLVHYTLGYTSNKWAFQRYSGWKMKDLIFISHKKVKEYSPMTGHYGPDGVGR